MWLSLLLLSTAHATDRTLALTLDGPEGPIAELEEAVPSTSEHPITLGRRDYVLVARTSEDNDTVSLTLDLKRVKANGKERWLEEAEVILDEAVAGEVTLKARTRGTPTRTSSWTAEGLWRASWAPPAQSPPPEKQLRYVLVWADAGLSADPRSGAYTARDTLSARDAPSTQLTPFRVVMEFSGEILEAKAVPADAAGDHCYHRPIDGVNDWDRQFFLRRQDLARVTTREVSATLDDGTGYTLAAGVAVTRAGGDRYTIEQDGLRFEASLPDEALSWFYRPSGHFPPTEGAPALSAAGGVLGHTADGPVHDSGGERRVDGATGVTTPLVVTRTGCVELTLSVDPAQIQQKMQ